MIRYLQILLFSAVSYSVSAQQLAFPGAEGFGKYTTGGRGGSVIEVTNLSNSGAGSLRAAVQVSGTRTIVFKVSGTIYLESPLEIKNGNVTIAGQTAPGDGITLANYNFEVKADNVIIRYIRCRMGDAVNQEDDAFTCRNRKDIMIDHCTFSWGIDEVASMYQNENFTMQWCIISESLYRSIHNKGDHGYGGIWGGSKATFHHNLLAHHSSRNPRFNGARYETAPWQELVDFRNNVIYNWGSNSSYGGDPSEIDGIKAGINMVSNYYKAGPATRTGKVQYRILEPYDMSSFGFSKWYIDSNFVYGYPDVTADNWLTGVQNVSEEEKTSMRETEPFIFDITTRHTAEEAFAAVLENAGTVLPLRDTIDKRIIYEVETGTAIYGGAWGAASGIIDSQTQAGGWPELHSAPAPNDRDHDGMPDAWEISNGLNPDDASDRNQDKAGEGYTNLEYYLNGIAPHRAFLRPPSGIQTEIAASSVNLTWKDNSVDEAGFFVERSQDNMNFAVLDTLMANVTSYNDTGLSPDNTYYYRLRAFNATDTSVYSSIITLTIPTGLNKKSLSRTVSLYPNPASNILYVYNPMENGLIKSVTILDSSGRTILKKIKVTNPHFVTISIADLKSGSYMVKVDSTMTQFIGKILVSR